MGLLGDMIRKAALRATIRTIGHAAAEVVAAKSNADAQRTNAQTEKINAEIERINATKSSVSPRLPANIHPPAAAENIRVKPPRSSAEYRDTDALYAVKELLGAGFVNITLKPQKHLNSFSKKYGRIRTITINGNGDFVGVRKIPSTSKIIITYSDFKEGTKKEIYTKVVKIIPGTIHSADDVAAMINPSTEIPIEIPVEDKSPKNSKKYCIYCGELITNEKARFCFACGKKIDE